jgi:hypothetical protein
MRTKAFSTRLDEFPVSVKKPHLVFVAFRIHGVSPEFISKLHEIGYDRPEPEQLIAMRIHGVTPEFIKDMRSHGMQDLTIDKLVSLRIHGID